MEKAVSSAHAEWQWFCVQTKPQCEDLAAINLFNRKITVFNPQIEEFYLRDGKRCRRIAPLFPSYIFANLILIHDYYRVKWAPGVKKIVGNGDSPIPVSDSVIHAILDNLESKEYIKVKKPKPGDKVTITRGAFHGLTGIFGSFCSGEERVKVLLELLHQQVEVELDYAFIKKAVAYCA